MITQRMDDTGCAKKPVMVGNAVFTAESRGASDAPRAMLHNVSRRRAAVSGIGVDRMLIANGGPAPVSHEIQESLVAHEDAVAPAEPHQPHPLALGGEGRGEGEEPDSIGKPFGSATLLQATLAPDICAR